MKKKISFFAFFFIVGIALAAFISTSAVREAYRNRKIEKEVENLKEEARRIQSENDSLSQRIAYFETSQFQEKIAKEKLNLQKPDENVVVVKPDVKPEPQVAGSQDEAVGDEKKVVNYVKWWNLFFKYD